MFTFFRKFFQSLSTEIVQNFQWLSHERMLISQMEGHFKLFFRRTYTLSVGFKMKPLKGRTHWNFSLRAFHEIQFLGHFINHEIISWNTFALVCQCHCVCFSSIKKLCLQRKDIFWQQKCNSINFVAQNKNIKPETYLNETVAGKQEQHESMC